MTCGNCGGDHTISFCKEPCLLHDGAHAAQDCKVLHRVGFRDWCKLCIKEGKQPKGVTQKFLDQEPYNRDRGRDSRPRSSTALTTSSTPVAWNAATHALHVDMISDSSTLNEFAATPATARSAACSATFRGAPKTFTALLNVLFPS